MLSVAVDLVVVWRLLRYGQPDTRRRLVADLLDEGDTQVWQVLAETVRSAEPWALRAHCLEALGIAAACADRALAERILGWTSGAETGRSVDEPPRDPLTGREREVAALVARGLTNREIATHLAISTGTVRAHLQHILDKLKVPKRAAIGTWIGRHAVETAEPLLRERNQESVS